MASNLSKNLEAPEVEDLTGLAGWVYTDLMLALMVIFLATISFVPQFMNISKTQNKNFSYSKVIETTMNMVYDTFDLQQIRSDVSRFKVNNGIPQDADIVYAQFVGGYRAASENPTMAISRALAFSQRLDQADKTFLKSAATTLSSSNVLTPQQVIIRLTFAVTSKINK